MQQKVIMMVTIHRLSTDTFLHETSAYSVLNFHVANAECIGPSWFSEDWQRSTLHPSVWHTGTFYRPAAYAGVLSLRLGLGGMREAKTIV